MFHPPFCPYRRCPAHTSPQPNHYYRHGFYKPKCRSHSVPRFRCRSCARTYSRQTFRMDIHDHKPYLNARLFELLTSGVGLRQSGRILNLTHRCVELKARKIGRHLRRLNVNLRSQLPAWSKLQMDEIETYESRRRERPVTFPIVLEPWSRFVIWGESAPIPPKGRMSEKRRLANWEEAQKRGYRRNGSNSAVRRTLARAAVLTRDLDQIRIDTDEKLTYPMLIRAAFPGKPIVHRRTSSKAPRTVKNPLFPINHTEAIARDLMGRLRRRSWLVSKKRRYLDIAFQLWMAWKNYVRPRFNGEAKSAAQYVGAAPHRLTIGELLGWRQERRDWPLTVWSGYQSPVRRAA